MSSSEAELKPTIPLDVLCHELVPHLSTTTTFRSFALTCTSTNKHIKHYLSNNVNPKTIYQLRYFRLRIQYIGETEMVKTLQSFNKDELQTSVHHFKTGVFEKFHMNVIREVINRNLLYMLEDTDLATSHEYFTKLVENYRMSDAANTKKEIEEYLRKLKDYIKS